MIARVSRERGRSWQLLEEDRMGATGAANSGMIRRPCVCGRWGRNADAPRYRQAKETKRGEKAVRKSQCPIVALKRGNGPSGPRGAKGVPRCGRGAGTTPRTPCLTSVSPRNDQVV